RAMARGLIRIMKRDFHATEADVEAAERLVESILKDFAERLGGDHPRFMRLSGRHFETADRFYSWLLAYERLGTFRTSLPSFWVRDGQEARRRGDPKLGIYQADLKTLLHRGQGLEWLPDKRAPDGTHGVVTVRGYGRWQRVDVAQTFSSDDTGQFFQMH